MSTTSPTRLILVRHGETAANREFRYIGSRDDVLTERGREQAAAIAGALRNFPIAAIYSSPRRRASATAEPLAALVGRHIVIHDALVENGFGSWEGLTRAEVLARSPEDAALLRSWEADPSISPPGGGESLTAMQQRVTLFADTLVAEHPGQTLVLVSHVGPIKGLICTALGAGPGTARSLFLDPATISVLDWGNRRTLRLFNSHAHLGWEDPRWRADG